MKEVLLTPVQVRKEIEIEDQCGVNDLLQQLLLNPDARVYYQINEEGRVVDWVIRDKKTGEDIYT